MEARSDIKQFIAESFTDSRDPCELADDALLMEGGVIDSVGVLELISYLENRFRIRIADDELTPDNLNSIDRLVQFIEDKLSQGVT